MHEFLKQIKNNKPATLPLTTSNALNEKIWTIAGVPLGGDQFWMYKDSNAVHEYFDNDVGISIDKFSLSHDQVQIFDNPKYLYLTRDSYKPGRSGKISFSCLMKTGMKNCNFEDYRDGFGSFNVLDFNSAMVFDIISNGRKLWIIYERLLVPGHTSPGEAFTEVIPLERPTHPDELLHCSVIYDRTNDSAAYFIDYDLVYEVKDIPVKIDTLQTGFGFITLHPIENGKSVSCRGQGGAGVWGDFRLYNY